MAGVAYTAPMLAIAGSPKDYTGIAAARQRQEAADEAKVKSEGKKKDEEIRKALRIEPGTYLPFRVAEIESAFTETMNSLDKAKIDGDFNAESEAMFKFKQKVADLQKEKKEYDEAKKGISQGTLVSRGDLSKVGSASSMNDFQDVIDSGAASVEPNTGRLQFNASKNVDFTQLWRGLSSNYKNKHTGKVVRGADGQEFYELAYDLPGLQAGLSATFDNDPNVEAKATITYERLHPEAKGLKPEDLRVKVKEDFIANGLEFGSEGQWQRKPGKGGLTLKFYTGGGGGLGQDQATPYGEFPPTSKIVYTNPTDPNKESVTGETENFFGFSAGNFKVVGAPPGEAVYNDSGKKVDDSQVRNTTFNQFLGRLVLTKDFKAPNGTVYPKGFSVPKEYKDLAIDNGYAKAAVVATGLSDNNESLSFNATGLTPSLYAGQSEAEKKQLGVQIDDARKRAAKLQADVDKQYLKARKEREAKGKPKPKPEPKPDASKDKPKTKPNVSKFF